MSVQCYNGTPAPTCALSCDELTCQLNALEANVTNLFNRTDDINEYLATGSNLRIVTTEAQLTAALAEGGMFFVQGIITLTGTAEIAIDNTRMLAAPNEDGEAGFFYEHQVGGAHHIGFLVKAQNVTIDGLSFDMDHPLTFDSAVIHIAISITNQPSFNPSGLRITNNRIINCNIPIYRAGASNSQYMDDAVLAHNSIVGFCGYGVYIESYTRNFYVANNRIWGQNHTELNAGQSYTAINQTHNVGGSCLWIGNFNERLKVIHNDLAYSHIHGMEIWNAQANTGGTDGVVIEGNTVHDLIGVGGSIAISVVANGGINIVNNVVRQVTGYGIETFNDGGNSANYNIVGNTIIDVIAPATSVHDTVGIILNSVISAHVTGNTIRNIRAQAGHKQYGVMIIGGAGSAHPGLPGGLDISIVANKFIDGGNYGVLLEGNGADTYTNIDISNNNFRLTSARKHEADEYAVVMSHCGLANVVKDNKLFYDSLDPPGGFVTGYLLKNGGTIYDEHAAYAAIVWAGVSIDFDGSNLAIPY